jgi:mannose-6-phosphate isomerase-like protein (cupin superfamily)
MEDNVRPWGFYENLADTDTHKVKRITVLPGKRLSLQRHLKRTEHWFVVSGSAVVTCGGREIALGPGGYTDIPRGESHRILNNGTGNLVFIEIQTGSYFGEDDIIRLEDDFGRA